MSFNSVNGQIGIGATGVGELWDAGGFKMTTRNFDSDIRYGRFAGFDGGVLTSGHSPEVVVYRDLNEDLEQVDHKFNPATSQIPLIRQGAVTVAVTTGQTPSVFGKVYMDVDGKATTDNAKPLTTAEFIRPIQTDVWLIRLV